MINEKRSFEGGLNGDDNTRILPPNQSLNIMNGRVGITEYGRYGRVENLPGTTAISQSVYPPYGTNFCLGSCVDADRFRIIYFNWNSFGYHAIYAYDVASGTTYAVIYDSQVTGGLGFSKSYRIDRNCKVVGNLLYWTDNNNEPRRINIEAGIKMNHASYSTTVTPYSYPMNASVINLIRRPYGLAVTPTKITSGSIANKFIDEFAGQFSHRLIYRDGEYSVLGVPSEMVNYNITPTDTYNAVQITFPLAETFDQDVQIIQLAVRYDNKPDYFVIKQWDKANATDLAEINSHNSGVTNLTYTFFNNTIGIPVGGADSVKPADSIPIKTKTIEFATNRLFLGNNLKGYDTPVTTSLTASLSANGSDPTSALALKSNSPYQIGIRFRDDGKRQSFVVTRSSCIVNNTDRTFTTVPYNSIAWSVSNAAATTEIPSWAKYYDILVTKNLRTRYFLQMFSSNIQYVVKNTDGTFSYQQTYTTSAYGIAVDLSLLTGLGLGGYVANLDDLCRLYLGSTSTVYELQVIGQDGNYVHIKPANIGSLNPQPGCYFEIYTPYQQSENETFYTTGQSYKITNFGTGSRTYSTTSGIITGDAYRFNNVILGHYEFMSPNANRLNEWVQFYGEANFKYNLGQVQKSNFVQWSNVIIVGAQTNGLSTFDAGDEKGLPSELGDLNKLQLTNKISDTGQGNIMLAIFPTETASLYLGETTVMGASQSAYVAQSTDVIGSVNVLNGSLGTIHPESVIAYLGNVYWIDVLNGVFVQYSPAGLEPVSRYKQSRFFKRYSKDYIAASTGNLDNINGFHHIPTGIDAFHKEIICTLPGLIYSNYASTLPSYTIAPSYATSIIDRFDIYDQLAKTMAFKYEDNMWGSNYEFMGEWYEYIENQMFGFKTGTLYSHNTNTTNWNTFYGTQYPVRICFTGNINPSLIKDLYNIGVEGNAAPDFAVALTTIPNQQITETEPFTNDEGIYYAYFLRDRLSPNASGTADEKMFKGDVLKDFAVQVMCEFQQYSSLFYVNFVNLGYQPSRGHNQILNSINT